MKPSLLLVSLVVVAAHLYAPVLRADQPPAWRTDSFHLRGQDRGFEDYLILADSHAKENKRKLTKEEKERRKKYYESLPLEEQKKIRKAQKTYREMSPERRKEMKDRWENMTPEERKRYRKWKDQQKTGQ